MSQFVHGSITYNIPAAQDGGVVYTRRLGLRTVQGDEIKIFDTPFPISEEISTATECTVVLSVLLPKNTRYSAIADGSTLADGWWQGVIRDTNWLPGGTYTYMHADFAEPGWVLIETPVGDMLMGYRSLKDLVIAQGYNEVAVGGVVQWEPIRFDLEAILLGSL